MLEAAAVIDITGAPIHWHIPAGRSAVSLPDSRSLWSVLWENRERLAGLAHTHPGGGRPIPSWEDLTTFSACEAGLGRRLDWWIATADQIRLFRFSGPTPYHYRGHSLTEPPSWLPALLDLSNPTSNDGAHHAV
ncbi:MAG: hypothetical protein ACI8RZ_006891 [Myxococcota bacterium]|jgi:hypothetical protein